VHFTGLDWAIILTYLGGSLLAGLYGKKYISGISEYLVAGRTMGVCVGIATLAATENGTVSFMYYAQLGYRTGFSAFMNSLLLGLALIFVGQTGFVVRKLRALRLMTIPEFFEKRYSRRLRILCAILMATGGILNLGIFLKVEGTFLTIISGLPIRYLNVIMVGILGLETVYTVLGGMVSILITDFIQFVFLSQATVLVTIYTIHNVGWGKMHDAVRATMGAGGFNPIINPEYGWAYIAFMILSDLSGDACWQPIEMRGFSTRDPKTSQRVFYWTGIIFLALGLMPMQWGIAALARLGPGFDSLQAMPVFLTTILPAGILGLVTAGMLAATMSVNSSYLLSWSSIIAQDIIIPLRKKALSSRGQVVLNRFTNLFVSLFILFWSLWYTLPGPAYFYLFVMATVFLAGTFAAVIGGLYWKRANTLGAYCALAFGIVGVVGFFFFNIKAGYAGSAAFALAAAGMVGGSLLGKNEHHKLLRMQEAALQASSAEREEG
jgi:solute:Na+ symporter, SSS family